MYQHSAVQYYDDLYTIRWSDCAVHKYSNILNGRSLKKTPIARLD